MEKPKYGRSLPEALRKADGTLILEACSIKGFKPAFPEISFNLITGAIATEVARILKTN